MTPAEIAAQMIAARRALGLGRTPRRILPRQLAPVAIERRYARELRPLLAAVRELFAPALEMLPRWLRQPSGAVAEARRELDAARVRLASIAHPHALRELAERIARDVAAYQRVQLSRQMRAGVGAEIFLPDRALAEIVEAFVGENVPLLQSTLERAFTDAEAAIMRAIATAAGHLDAKQPSPFAAALQEIGRAFERAKTRANTVAADQVEKVYGQINRARQKALGIESYVWRTMRDSRVRPEHADREGKVFRWDRPPRDGHPGQPPMCRCHADPVLDPLVGQTANRSRKASPDATLPGRVSSKSGKQATRGGRARARR